MEPFGGFGSPVRLDLLHPGRDTQAKMPDERSLIIRADSEKLWTPTYALTLIANVFAFTVMYLQFSAFPSYLAELSGDRGLAGFATGIYTGAALLLRPAAGWFLDRWGRRAGLAAGAAGLVAASALYFPFSSSVAAFLVLRAASGAAFCFLSTSAGALVADAAPPSRLGEGIGYFALSTVAGSVLGPMIGLSLHGRALAGHSIGAVLTAALGLCGAGAIAAFLALRSLGGTAAPRPAAPASENGRVGALRFAPSFSLFFAAVPLGFILSYIHALGVERGVQGAGRFFVFYSLSVLAVRVSGARFIDRIRPASLSYAAFASLAACCGMLAFAGSYAFFMAAACFFGAAIGILQPLLNTLQIRFLPARMRGTASAAYFAAMDLGITVGSIGIGLAVGSLGFTMIFVFFAVLAFAVAAAFHWAIRPSARAARP